MQQVSNKLITSFTASCYCTDYRMYVNIHFREHVYCVVPRQSTYSCTLTAFSQHITYFGSEPLNPLTLE